MFVYYLIILGRGQGRLVLPEFGSKAKGSRFKPRPPLPEAILKQGILEQDALAY